jgi:hypothetical protein
MTGGTEMRRWKIFERIAKVHLKRIYVRKNGSCKNRLETSRQRVLGEKRGCLKNQLGEFEINNKNMLLEGCIQA